MKSIQKILINIDDFHYGIDSDDIQDADRDYVHLEIKNGWLYEAVSHAEQVIEDLFSVLMTSKDIDTFAKDVIQCRKGKKYIWDFDDENLEYVAQEFCVPFFDG